jgi:hypothetical protein
MALSVTETITQCRMMMRSAERRGTWSGIDAMSSVLQVGEEDLMKHKAVW